MRIHECTCTPVVSMVTSIYILSCQQRMSPCISLSAPAYKTPVWCSFQPTPQHAHMHACKHAWNDSVAATVREADADAGSSGRLLCSTQEIAFSTSNARTSLYPIPETPIPLNPPSLGTPPPLFPANPRTVRGPVGKRSCTVPTLISIQSAPLWP